MEIYILCFVIGIILYYLINKFCRCNNGFSIGIDFNVICTEEEFLNKKILNHLICSKTSTLGEYRYRPIGNPGDPNISNEEITNMAGEKYWIEPPVGGCTLKTQVLNPDLCYDDLRRRVLEQYESQVIETEEQIEEVASWKPGGSRMRAIAAERVAELQDELRELLDGEQDEKMIQQLNDAILFYTADDTGEDDTTGGGAATVDVPTVDAPTVDDPTVDPV